MIIALLLSFLTAGGRRDLYRWVFGGALAAVLTATAVGLALYAMAKTAFVGSGAQTWFETLTFIVAVVVLTYMTFWMKRNARSFNSALRAQTAAAMGAGSSLALAVVAFVTVGREALETAIFTVAVVFASTPLELGIGAAAGLAVALAISYAVYRVGTRFNYARFFTVVGAGLILVAAGLLGNAARNLQELHALPATPSLWDTTRLLPDESTMGDVLHGLLGYSAQPYVLQFVVWVLFIVITLVVFLLPERKVVRRGHTFPAPDG